IGRVYGKTPEFTTAFYHELDSTDRIRTSGSVGAWLNCPGVYDFKAHSLVQTTVCDLQPDGTDRQDIRLYAIDDDDAVNNGCPNGKESVGEPVNVTNGNMYLSQTDYQISGLGEGLHITRSYNSGIPKDIGVFGNSWSSNLDVSLGSVSDGFLRLNWNDGRAVYFARNDPSQPMTPIMPRNFRGQITDAADGAFDLTMKDGWLYRFTPAGLLASITDRNGNQTAYVRDADGRVTSLVDASGRVLTVSYGDDGRVHTISDSLGVVATYTYGIWLGLESVTYADGSGFR